MIVEDILSTIAVQCSKDKALHFENEGKSDLLQKPKNILLCLYDASKSIELRFC